MARLRHFVETSMSGRSQIFGKTVVALTFLSTSSLLLAQSQWREIPVGYNMPKTALSSAVTADSAMAFAGKGAAKTASKSSAFAGEGPDPNHRWEVEFHGGGFFNVDSGSGSALALPTGTSFFGGTSTQVSSYMFGDGANLFNQVATATGISNSIVPLDSVLSHPFGTRNNGAALGVRFGRDITKRFNLDFSVDWSTSALEIRDSRLLAIQNTATSFQNSFADLFTNSCGCTNNGGTVVSARRSEGSQLFWTGAVNVNLKTSGKTIPYLSFGGGGISSIGPAPHAGIFGTYSFTAAGPHTETDIVNIEATSPRTQGVGVLGIGLKYFATPRWGLRLDVRDYISPNRIDTLLSASPNVATLAPAETINPPTTPKLVFSNDPTLGPSSLSGPALNRVRTFKGDGMNNQVNLSIGVFYRF